MQVIGFFENNKPTLTKLLATLSESKADFFDIAGVEKALQHTVMRQFLTRLYHECVFLNSVYLDYFNNRDEMMNLAEHYNFDTVEECQAFIDLAREVHETIHAQKVAGCLYRSKFFRY